MVQSYYYPIFSSIACFRLLETVNKMRDFRRFSKSFVQVDIFQYNVERGSKSCFDPNKRKKRKGLVKLFLSVSGVETRQMQRAAKAMIKGWEEK